MLPQYSSEADRKRKAEEQDQHAMPPPKRRAVPALSGSPSTPVDHQVVSQQDNKPNVPLRRDLYTVGWICALPKEQTAAIAMLDRRHSDIPGMKPSSDTNAYALGSIGKHNIVIACLPKGHIGLVPAATVASRMVTTFPSVKIGLMVGIGGGIPSKVRLGDVVISTPIGTHPGVVQWDMGKTKEGGKFERTGALNNPPTFLLTALTHLESDHEMGNSKVPIYLDELKEKWPNLTSKYLRSDSLRDIAFQADVKHVAEDNPPGVFGSNEGDAPEECRLCDKTKAIQRELQNMRIHYGLIASGNQVIKDGIFREKLDKDLGGNVLCFDMEAAGLMTNFPCLVIRGICDYADSHKNKRWQEHAAATAAAVAKAFLAYVQPEVIQDERPVGELLQESKWQQSIRSTLSKCAKQHLVHETVAATGTNVDNLGRIATSEESLKVLKWLTPHDYGPQQSDLLARHQPGTNQWFWDSIAFQDWLGSRGKTIFSTGIPGSGKTITTSFVIDHLSRLFHDEKQVGIAYVYCSYHRSSHQDLKELLASLLKQLSQTQDDLPDSVTRLHQRHGKRRTRPSVEELTKALIETSGLFSRVFIIIDALDEIQPTGDHQSSLLSHLARLRTETSANIFLTSRYMPDIKDTFGGFLKQDIRATDEDVLKFVEDHLPKSSQWPHGKLGDLEEKIKSKITDCANGMFLLAQLHLDSLAHKTSPAEVREALAAIEDQGSVQSWKSARHEVLYQAYDQAMDRIKKQLPDFRNLGLQTLAWVVHARRPLTTHELQHALSVKKNSRKLDADNIRKIEMILSACAGLVTVDEKSNIVRLAHFTTQEYFELTRKNHFPNAQDDIATACVTYLSFHDCKAAQFFRRNADFDSFHLLSYASENWGHHAREVAILNRDVFDFLMNDANVTISCNISASMRQLRIRSGLECAAYFGLRDAAEMMLRAPRAHWDSFASSLSIACQNGHEPFVRLMLDNGGNPDQLDSPDLLDSRKRTNLASACLNGHAAVVELLLDRGASVNDRSFDNWTPLHFASESGHSKVVEILLARGAITEAATEADRWRPLHLAADHGHELVVEALLEKNAQIEATTHQTQCRTPLYLASEKMNAAVVQMLLQHGARPGPDPPVVSSSALVPMSYFESDYPDWSPLHLAAQAGDTRIAKMLLEKGAYVEAVTKEGGWTPLHFASEYGFLDIAKLMLENNANVMATTREDSWTPLHLACESGNSDLVKMLLDHAATVTATTTKDQWTPLHVASEFGDEVSVKILLDLGADGRAESAAEMTPLSLAREQGHDAVVEELVKWGVNKRKSDMIS